MKKWIYGVMDKYRIKDMYELRPPYSIDQYYGHDDSKLFQLVLFIKEAIRLIEDRFLYIFYLDRTNLCINVPYILSFHQI